MPRNRQEILGIVGKSWKLSGMPGNRQGFSNFVIQMDHFYSRDNSRSREGTLKFADLLERHWRLQGTVKKHAES